VAVVAVMRTVAMVVAVMGMVPMVTVMHRVLDGGLTRTGMSIRRPLGEGGNRQRERQPDGQQQALNRL
jgi:hypothetical protein